MFSKAIMDELRPGARATVVTSDFHAFRATLLARRLGIRGQVTGARVAGYYRPPAPCCGSSRPSFSGTG